MAGSGAGGARQGPRAAPPMAMTISPLHPAQLNALLPVLAPQPWLPRLRWLAATPYALLLHARNGAGALGFAGALRFGPQAQVVLLRTVPHGHAGTAAALLRALTRGLLAGGAQGIAGVATAGSEALWRAQGYAAHEPLLRLHGGLHLEATHAEVVPLAPVQWMAALRLDRLATGLARAPLLLEHAFLAQAYVERGAVRGFALPLLGHGLIVADAPQAGLELQRWLLPAQRHLLLPAASAARHHLAERGYAEQTVGTRMVLGPDTARPAWLHAEPFGAA